MYTHEGTKQGHKKWKMSARAFFRKPNTMVIHHILQGHIQIERIVENWPKKVDLNVDSLTTLPGTLAGTLGSPLSTPKPNPSVRRGRGKKTRTSLSGSVAPAIPAPTLWTESDVIYTSKTAWKSTDFTILDLVTADAELMQKD